MARLITRAALEPVRVFGGWKLMFWRWVFRQGEGWRIERTPHSDPRTYRTKVDAQRAIAETSGV